MRRHGRASQVRSGDGVISRASVRKVDAERSRSQVCSHGDVLECAEEDVGGRLRHQAGDPPSQLGQSHGSANASPMPNMAFQCGPGGAGRAGRVLFGLGACRDRRGARSRGAHTGAAVAVASVCAASSVSSCIHAHSSVQNARRCASVTPAPHRSPRRRCFPQYEHVTFVPRGSILWVSPTSGSISSRSATLCGAGVEEGGGVGAEGVGEEAGSVQACSVGSGPGADIFLSRDAFVAGSPSSQVVGCLACRRRAHTA